MVNMIACSDWPGALVASVAIVSMFGVFPLLALIFRGRK
jgi:hypothetical protein